MYCKKIRWGTLVLTVCFCLLPVKTAFADTMVGGVSTSVTQEIGPGVTTTPWERYGEHYIDGQGNPIGGVFSRGISVSRFQGNIDWSRVANDDVSFVFVRMVSYGYEGGYTIDSMFDQNMRGAGANGIQAAPYVYL